MVKSLINQFFTKQFAKYIIVGLIATLLDFSFLWLLVEFGHLHYFWAAILSVMIVLWFSFTLNKYWTFKNLEKKYFQQFIKYTISHAIALGVNLIVLTVLVEFFNLWYIFAKIFATAAAAITNFLLVKKFIFSEDNESKK